MLTLDDDNEYEPVCLMEMITFEGHNLHFTEGKVERSLYFIVAEHP